MTIQGAINELFDLIHAEDIPVYYKGSIQKVIETIVMEFEDRKTENSSEIPNNCEPQQKSCATCKHALGNWDGESNNCGRCCGADRRFYEPKDEPQTERSSE